MRKLIFTLLLVGSMLTSYGQYYYLTHANGTNPGGLNTLDEFPVGGGLDASWTTILGPGQTTPAWSPTINIPFPFSFNGSAVTQYKVSSSGVLTFDVAATAVPSGTNAALPNAGVPDQSVCVWGLAGPGTNDNIVVQTFGNMPNRQHWVFFTSYNYTGGPANCWVYFSIVLEEGTNNIYIVDQRTANCTAPALTLGIQIDNMSAHSVTGSPAYVPMATDNDPSAADNTYYQFIQGVQPQYDMSALAVTNSTWMALANAPFSIQGDFTNYGTATISSFDFNYSVNGGATVTANITSPPLVTQGVVNATSPTTWTPPATGAYTIEIWASNINGNPDANTANDKVTKMVNVHGPAINRRSLHEDFTSSSCPPCLPGGIQLRGVLDANAAADHTYISYPMTWPSTGDPYNTTENNDRRTYYGVNAIPNLFVDGQWDGNPNVYTQGIFDSFQEVPSFLTINADYTISDQTVQVTVELDPLQANASNDLRLHVMIMEDTSYNNRSNDNPNGETEWHHYVKKMIPDAGGTALQPLTAGNKVTIPFPAHTFPGMYRLPNNSGDAVNLATEHNVEDFCNLEVIVFVQDNATQEVLQSTRATRGCPMMAAAVTQTPDNGSNNGTASAQVAGGVGPYTYLWSDGQTTPMANGLAAGTYTVTITDCSGCPTTGTIDVESNVSIDDLLEAGINGLNVFPNPSNGTFTYEVDMNRVDNLAISLYDINGKVVYTDKAENVNTFSNTVSLENVSAGIYMLGVQTSTGQGYKRVVIK